MEQLSNKQLRVLKILLKKETSEFGKATIQSIIEKGKYNYSTKLLLNEIRSTFLIELEEEYKK